jgi:hypothetical protein
LRDELNEGLTEEHEVASEDDSSILFSEREEAEGDEYEDDVHDDNDDSDDSDDDDDDDGEIGTGPERALLKNLIAIPKKRTLLEAFLHPGPKALDADEFLTFIDQAPAVFDPSWPESWSATVGT